MEMKKIIFFSTHVRFLFVALEIKLAKDKLTKEKHANVFPCAVCVHRRTQSLATQRGG